MTPTARLPTPTRSPLLFRTLRTACTAAVSLALLACTSTNESSPTASAMPDIVIHVVGERPAKPPLVRLIVDVQLTNSSNALAWVSIDSRVPTGRGGGVDAMEEFSAGGVTFARFLGTGGFYALALAPRASLTLENLEIGWWTSSDATTPPPIEVRSATGVTIAGEAIGTWFHGDPIVRGSVRADAANATPIHSRRVDHELAVTRVDEATLHVAMQSGAPTAALDPPEWQSGFPVPAGARRDKARSGATSLGPGKNHQINAFEIDAPLETVAAFFARHLLDSQRVAEGDVVRFTRTGGSVELRRHADKCRFTIRVGPF